MYFPWRAGAKTVAMPRTQAHTRKGHQGSVRKDQGVSQKVRKTSRVPGAVEDRLASDIRGGSKVRDRKLGNQK